MQGSSSLHQLLLLVLALVCTSQGVSYYYKTRAPPLPPLPPAKLHYGPKPPSPAFYHHFTKLPPSTGYHHIHPYDHLHTRDHLHAHEHLHAHVLRPALAHHHIPLRQPIRIPLRPLPYIAKPTPPPPPLHLPTSWKTLSSFRPPVLKETFHASPQSEYTHSDDYIKHDDDDKGPIHTIPAPNLGPADKPPTQSLFNTFSSPALDYGKPDPSSDLTAVLNHAAHVVNQPLVSPHGGYQVTEDPSLHRPSSPQTSYFAPDPDPHVPTPKVPETTDPFSQPSNGQQPIDLVLQQQVEQQQLEAAQLVQQQQLQAQLQLQQLQQQYLQPQHQQAINVQPVAATTSNTLTSQDLYNLFNGFSQQQQQYLAQPQLDYQQLYNSALLYQPQQPQQHQPLYQQEAQLSQQEFHPQFQTFNYDEQTQQGAHGSDSFPSASISIEVKRALPKQSVPTGYSDNALKGENSILSSLANLNLLQKSNIAVRSDTSSYQNKKDSEILAAENESEGVISNQVDYDDKLTEPKETQSESSVINPNFYTTLPNKKAAETLATLAAAGNINNQIMKGASPDKEDKKVNVNDYSEENEDVEQDEVFDDGEGVKEVSKKSDKNEKDNNVQTNSYHFNEESYYNQNNKQENSSDDKDYDDTEMEYSQEEEPEQTTQSASKSPVFNAHSQSQIPYGYKLIPKRV